MARERGSVRISSAKFGRRAENTHVDEAGVESPSSIWTYGSCEADFFMSLRLSGEASFSLSFWQQTTQKGPLGVSGSQGRVDEESVQ